MAAMWYLLHKDARPPLSLHAGKAQALQAAHHLLCERGDVVELGPVGKNKSRIVGLDDVTMLWVELHVRRIGIVTATLGAAFIGAGLLVLMPGDQTEWFLEWLFSRAAGDANACDLC